MSPGRETPQKSGSRTAAAGSEFLKAIAADFAVLAGQIRGWLTRQSRGLAQQWQQRGTRQPAAIVPARTTGRSLRQLALGAAVVGLAVMFALSGALLWALLGLPIEQPESGPVQPTLLLTAATGEPLGRAGPLRIAEPSLRDFAPILIKAVLSTEDRRFYQNPGIDLWSILRAAYANRRAGQIVQGASTITQQLVKLEYLKDDRSYVWKLREALMAMWLETHLSKDQILTRYLNHVYLGDGAFGMAAAARLYFDKSPADLALPQAAMLAGLIKAPSAFDPLRHLKAAQARAATVLDDMVANHTIDAAAASAAKASPAILNPAPELAPARSWFADWAANQAAPLAGGQTGIVRVRTTFVPELQSLAQQTLDDALTQKGRELNVSEGALVAMRPNGAVLAMVGGRHYQKSQFNRATDANRQPGSSFKLFVYLAALRKGYTPQDTIDAGPIKIKGWKPDNFDNEHYGHITLAEAFAQSVNTAAVRLAMDVGLDNVVAAARDLGINEPLPEVPSLALGSAGVSLVDMTGAFACVRADHMHERPWGVAAIGNGNGSRMLATAPSTPLQSLDPYQKPLVDLLQGVVEHGTGRAAALNGFAAGKTGTSQDYRDAWFIGFNNALVVGVWVGNDDDSPMKGVVGGSLPASIWKAFVTQATPLMNQEGVRVALMPGTSGVGPRPDEAGLDEEASQGSSEPSNPGCDVQACASFYHSFRQSDCTYQPYDGGPRQICEKTGSQSVPTLPTEVQPTGAQSTAAQSTPPQHASKLASDSADGGQCNIERCSQTYSSFNPSDCTYQPFGGGPRQLCEK